jgi:anaerobic selenocysteine-containing dehydrogenase
VTLDDLRASPGGIRVALSTRFAKHADLDPEGVPRGFATPSRKVEIWSETFLANGYSPLPDYEEPMIGPAARPELANKFPLILTSAKNPLFCNSQHRGLPSLRKRDRDPTVELHPDCAAARRINAGDWVTIDSPEGSIRARAKLNASLDPRVVVGQHGWWQGCEELGAPHYDPFGPDGSNFNTLIGTVALDPISGTAPHKSYLCDVRAIA